MQRGSTVHVSSEDVRARPDQQTHDLVVSEVARSMKGRRTMRIFAVDIRPQNEVVRRENLPHDVDVALLTCSMQRVRRADGSYGDRWRLTSNEVLGENTNETVGVLLVVTDEPFDACDLRAGIYADGNHCLSNARVRRLTDGEKDIVEKLDFVMKVLIVVNQREAIIVDRRGAVANEEQAVASIGRVSRREQLFGFVSADVRMVEGDRLRLSEQSLSVLLKKLSEGLHLKQMDDGLLEIMSRLVER